MKVAIISDTHDNVANTQKFLDWVEDNEIGAIIHCGDLCAPAMLLNVLNRFKGKIHMVYGNVEDRKLTKELIDKAKVLNVIHYGDVGEVEITGLKIAFVHYPVKAEKLVKKGEYDFVFYGHNHKPWIDQVDSTYIANPGTLAGMFNKATFAVLDTQTKKLELKILETV